MKRIISTLLTLLIPILISAQCWIEQGVQDMSNPDISSDFKALFKSSNSEYADAYRLLYDQAFNLRNDVSILKKLNNSFESVVNDLENVKESFLNSDIIHLDLAGYNKYPEAVKICDAPTLDDLDTPIYNLLQGKIKDYLPKFKNNSIDRITIENAPYRDDILEEVNRITKDGASIELEHFSDLNIPYNEVADKVGGGIKKKETFIKSDYEYTRVTIIKGEQFIDDFTNQVINNITSKWSKSQQELFEKAIQGDALLSNKLISVEPTKYCSKKELISFEIMSWAKNNFYKGNNAEWLKFAQSASMKNYFKDW